MRIIGLWAINGIGLGHTARISLIGKALTRKGVKVKFLVEHLSQRDYLRRENHAGPILIQSRPWKLPQIRKQTAELRIKTYLSDIDGFIGDLGSIPQRKDIYNLIPSNVTIHFLLRWMTKQRWESFIGRLSFYERAKAVVVSPREFFETVTQIDTHSFAGLDDRLVFLDGFIFHRPRNVKRERTPKIHSIAFCCGAGGVHSTKGLHELQEVVTGLDLIKQRSGDNVTIDAWIGNNKRLENICSNEHDFFRGVYGANNSPFPNWNEYELVVGRCGYNTFLEVMSTRALFLTSAFESDGEWKNDSLR